MHACMHANCLGATRMRAWLLHAHLSSLSRDRSGRRCSSTSCTMAVACARAAAPPTSALRVSSWSRSAWSLEPHARCRGGRDDAWHRQLGLALPRAGVPARARCAIPMPCPTFRRAAQGDTGTTAANHAPHLVRRHLLQASHQQHQRRAAQAQHVVLLPQLLQLLLLLGHHQTELRHLLCWQARHPARGASCGACAAELLARPLLLRAPGAAPLPNRGCTPAQAATLRDRGDYLDPRLVCVRVALVTRRSRPQRGTIPQASPALRAEPILSI